MSDAAPEVHRGLAGVTADTSAVSVVDEETGSLLYRGYPVPDLAASCSFEEVAYLIWYGELPGPSELESFQAAERSRREVPPEVSRALSGLSLTCHPMDVLRTAVSYLGAQDPTEDDPSTEAELQKSLDLWAKLPTIVAAEQRRRNGQPPIAPDPGLSFAENFFHMCSGEVARRRDSALPSRSPWCSTRSTASTHRHLRPASSRPRFLTCTRQSPVRSARSKARFTAAQMKR